MNRNRWLLPSAIAVLLFGVIYHIWANWGLVTVHSTKDPLSKVIREIEKQGHVTIKTDLDPATPIYMNVDKVVVTEAIETLATVTEARWRLAFFVAGDKASVTSAIANVTAGHRPDGWKTASAPPLQIGEAPVVPPDPRRFVWTPAAPVAPAEPNLQTYLASAANQTSATIFYPEAWNPEVKNVPQSGPVIKAVPKLVSAVRGEEQSMFLLQENKRFAGGPPPEDDGSGPPQDVTAASGGRRGGNGGRQFDQAAMDERMKAQLAQLSPSDRAKAEAEIAARRAFFESLKGLTDAERQAKMQDMMSDPSAQAKADARNAAQDNRRSPEQRLARSHSYVDRKASMQSASTGGGK